nr:PAS domain-containing protein [Kineococcus aurantiacus]
MPPTADPTLSIFLDALLVDDERGRDLGLLVQGDGLTREVLLELLRRAGRSSWWLLSPPLAALLAERAEPADRPGPGDRALPGGRGLPGSRPEPLRTGEGLLDPRAGAWELDHRSRTVSWDPQCAALLDVHPAAGATLEDQLQHHVHPDDRDRVAEALDHACRTGQRYEQRYRTRMGDGGYAWRLSSGRLIVPASGSGPRVVGVIAALPA